MSSFPHIAAVRRFLQEYFRGLCILPYAVIIVLCGYIFVLGFPEHKIAGRLMISMQETVYTDFGAASSHDISSSLFGLSFFLYPQLDVGHRGTECCREHERCGCVPLPRAEFFEEAVSSWAFSSSPSRSVLM